MKNLFVLKKVIEDKDLSDEAFTVWCALRNIMQKDMMNYFISYNLIAYALYGVKLPTRTETNAIKKGYSELKEKNLIKENFIYSSTEFLVDLTELYYEKCKGYFSDLTDDEMTKIMNLKNIGKINNCKLLRYFTCMIGTFNRSNTVDSCYKGKIGGMSLDYFSEVLGTTKKTINIYNKILEENELLFVVRHKDFIHGTNAKGQSELREIPNTYSRWCDRELAQSFVENIHGYKYFNEQKDIRTDESNRKRGLAQKYNSFKNGKEYDLEVIKELYKYCEEWNENQLAYHNEQVSRGFKHELQEKDMSIFDDYLLDILDTMKNDILGRTEYEKIE